MGKVNIFLTVDTETSIGGAFRDASLKPVGNESRVFCRFNEKEYGIPLILSIAERFGLRLTFFVEIMSRYFFGEKQPAEVCDLILAHGHDVQLHVHPNYLNFTLDNPQRKKFSDAIGTYGLEQQIHILGEAKRSLEGFGARNVQAFRAGSYSASKDTLKALRAIGISIDSSYNRAYIDHGCCLLPDLAVNDLCRVEGIWELPVTNFWDHTIPFSPRLKCLDINGIHFSEIRHILSHAAEVGPRNITLVMHSFSFIKNYDLQYAKVRPRMGLIKEFESLCRFLSENREIFNVCVLGDLSESFLEKSVGNSVHHFPRTPRLRSIQRNFRQLMDSAF